MPDTTRDINIHLPSIVATKEFTPSGVMVQTLCAYLEGLKSLKTITPIETLVELGHHRTNWYQWLKKPMFAKWWSMCCEEFHQKTGLWGVYSAIYRNAMANSQADRKLYLERFDRDYKPQSKTEIEAYQGRRPPNAVQDSKDRLKAFNESLPGPQQGPPQSTGQEKAIEGTLNSPNLIEGQQGDKASEGAEGGAGEDV